MTLEIFLLICYIAVLAWNAGADFSMLRFLYISSGIFIVAMLVTSFYVFTRKTKDTGKAAGVEINYVPAKGEYRDNLVEISGDAIVFQNYYFPAGTKRIKLSEVEYVEEKAATLRNGKWRLHGTGNFKTWFPADYDRPSRDKIFVMKVKGKWMTIGFTVENSKVVAELFRNQGLLR